MRKHYTRNRASNQHRSSSISPESVASVLAQLRSIIHKHRRAVLHGDGLKAFGEALEAFGGSDAVALGVYTISLRSLRRPEE
jgi:hypothetical protein